jgi:hypothetical protein
MGRVRPRQIARRTNTYMAKHSRAKGGNQGREWFDAREHASFGDGQDPEADICVNGKAHVPTSLSTFHPLPPTSYFLLSTSYPLPPTSYLLPTRLSHSSDPLPVRDTAKPGSADVLAEYEHLVSASEASGQHQCFEREAAP